MSNSLEDTNLNLSNIYDKFDINKCIDWIKEHNLQRICLQFPNELLQYASRIALEIEKQSQRQIFILGDTNYESCCVDFIAAAHLNADSLIHFGDTCFSQNENKIPILTVTENVNFPFEKFQEIIRKFGQQNDQAVCIVCDLQFHNLLEQIKRNVENINCINHVCILEEFKTEYADNINIFIGKNERTLANFQYYYNIETLYYCDPTSNDLHLEKYSANHRAFKRRQYLIEKIKDANTVGIVVGTLVVKNYLKVLNRLKQLCKLYEKKSYILSVGKPNVAKLANFQEIDIFVVIACPVNEIYDSRDYQKPIVAPYDVEIALNPLCNKRPFNPYNFNELDLEDELPDKQLITTKYDGDISMVSGKVRHISSSVDDSEELNNENNQELALKNDALVASNEHHGAGYLASRTWKGLTPRLGDDEPSALEAGRSGLPVNYEI